MENYLTREKLKKSFNKDTNIYSKAMSFSDNSILPVVYGDHDRFLKIIEKKMDVSIVTRGNFLKISGAEIMVQITEDLLETLFKNAQALVLTEGDYDMNGYTTEMFNEK